MNIDERLEKLVERHEALTERHQALAQTVELIAIENRSLEALARNVIGGIQDLAQIARSHEQRISDLER